MTLMHLPYSSALSVLWPPPGCQIHAPARARARRRRRRRPPFRRRSRRTSSSSIPRHDEVVGELQVTHVQGEDTLPDIARRFNLGYEEIVRANPGVDPWLPGVGREIVLPTQFVLPAAPREGSGDQSCAAARVLLSEGEGRRAADGHHASDRHRQGRLATPEGTTKVTGKRKNPTWFPPASVRKEHTRSGRSAAGESAARSGQSARRAHDDARLAELSDSRHEQAVRRGPALEPRLHPLLSRRHRASCTTQIPVGTKVTVVNQPFVFGWHEDALYVQAFPVMEDDQREHPKAADALLNAAISDEMWQKVEAARRRDRSGSGERDGRAAARHRDCRYRSARSRSTAYIAAARHVENRVPEGANWNGKDEMLVTAEEFEAMMAGTPRRRSPPASRPRRQPPRRRPAALRQDRGRKRIAESE